MLQSKLFFKTSKTAPADDVSVNARLLEQGGYVQKVMAGVYSYLPLGMRVLSKIENIVREEMNKVEAQEVLMPSLQPKKNWVQTKRWETLDILFKIKSAHGFDYALGPTHEEIVTPMASLVVGSYKDLPAALFQIQTKFRDEPRAKSGLLRGREFRMKDLYSFHTTEEDLERYYDKVSKAYLKIFKRLGIDAVFTEASGGTFSKYSHEYQVEIPDGEDTIFVCQNCSMGKNKEIFEKNAICTNCKKREWKETSASEVGNIFKLKDKFTTAFNFLYTDAQGSKKPVVMGCYGIGTSRVMGVIVEKFHTDSGINWPDSVAPYRAHLLVLPGTSKAGEVLKQANKCYESLLQSGIEVLYDDREVSPGVKFADSDLLGIPYRLVISDRTINSLSGKKPIEFLRRGSKTPEYLDIATAVKRLQNK